MYSIFITYSRIIFVSDSLNSNLYWFRQETHPRRPEDNFVHCNYQVKTEYRAFDTAIFKVTDSIGIIVSGTAKRNAVIMLEAKVMKLLKGDALDENEELCDFTLAHQNEACGE